MPHFPVLESGVVGELETVGKLIHMVIIWKKVINFCPISVAHAGHRMTFCIIQRLADRKDP